MGSQADALSAYMEARRQEVSDYVARSFGLRPVWALHRRYLWQDVAINLLNSMITIPLLMPKKIASFAEKLGIPKVEGLSAWIPAGLPSRFQNEMAQVLRSDLFGGRGPFVVGSEMDGRFRAILKKEIRELSLERAATADQLSSLVPLAVGYWWFSGTAYTASEIGRHLAASVARKQAVSDFFLGEAAGSVFYDIFPAGPSDTEVMAATALMVVLFAVSSVVIHVLCDPFQRALGAQERRLQRLIDSLEMKLLWELRREAMPD